MIVLRTLALIFLGILTAGFGLCAVTSAIFAIGAPPLLLLTVVMAALTWLCVRGIAALNGSGEAQDSESSGASKDKSANRPEND